ncbi:MAG: hypothetical protein ABH864_00420 [archaeon]
MAKWTRKEDKEALLDIVREEIEAHRAGILDGLSTNIELAEATGFGLSVVRRALRDLSDRDYRTKQLQVSSGKSVGAENGRRTYESGSGIHGMSAEQRSEIGRRNYEQGNGIGGLSTEQRREIGRKSGEKNRDEGTGVHGLDREQRVENAGHAGRIGGRVSYERGAGTFAIGPERRISLARKGGRIGGRVSGRANREMGRGIFAMSLAEKVAMGRTNYKNGVGIASLDSEQLSAAGKKGSDVLRKTRYSFNGNHYHSKSEAVVHALLERHISGAEIAHQVESDMSITPDFLVGDTFVEWHPILMFKGKNGLGDMPSAEQSQKYKGMRAGMSPERAKVFERRYKKILAADYLAQRQAAVDASDLYSGRDVALVQTLGELYDFISQRGEGLPSRAEFVREFRDLSRCVNEVRKEEAA